MRLRPICGFIAVATGIYLLSRSMCPKIRKVERLALEFFQQLWSTPPPPKSTPSGLDSTCLPPGSSPTLSLISPLGSPLGTSTPVSTKHRPRYQGPPVPLSFEEEN